MNNLKGENIDRQSYHRAWIMQLHREHEKICRQYGVDLAVPIIEISQSTSCWGSWFTGTSTLAVSKALIEQHSWEVVINVFKHEMAHQVVSEIFGSNDKHGELFKKACDKLGVPGDFRGASGDLPRTVVDFKNRATASGKEKFISKIEKLLSLAQSTNEHEAQLAMEKANSFIARYNLEQIHFAQEKTYDFTIINHQKKRIENYQRKICFILSNYFFVKVILADLYDAKTCCTHKTIEIFGTRENVLIADYVYSFLFSHLSSLWNQYRKNHTTSGRQKRSYWLGILDGFSRKLAEQKKKRENANATEINELEKLKSLTTTSDHELNSFINQRYPRLSTKKFRSSRLHCKEYSDGKKDGLTLILNKGICQKDGFLGSLLPK